MFCFAHECRHHVPDQIGQSTHPHAHGAKGGLSRKGVQQSWRITYSKENVGPRARRVGDHAAYIVDRLNNAGLSEDAMVILRHSVDGRVTPEQYEARIAERKRMEA
jgi:hypothetical protein